MTAGDVLKRLTSAFDRTGIAYMLTGSFASAYYGASRSTQDIDLVIEATPTQLELLVRQLPAEHYYVDLPAALEAHRRQSLFNVIDLATGWKIDLIIRKARAFSEEEFGRRRLVDLQGIPISVASPEDVVISKLEWARLSQSQRQIEDAATILRSRWESLDREYLKKWIEDLHLSAEWNSALAKSAL
jgi:uncharacterized nucleotidyltransferase DUF6036